MNASITGADPKEFLETFRVNSGNFVSNFKGLHLNTLIKQSTTLIEQSYFNLLGLLYLYLHS